MRLPIQLALSYPERLQPTTEPLDLAAVGSLDFARPDLDRYPCLRLAIAAGRQGGTCPAAMAAADEVAVGAFLQRRIRYTDIPGLVEAALERHQPGDDLDIEQIDRADAGARRFTEQRIAGIEPP